MSEKIWSDDAWRDYLYWQTHDKKVVKRINQLIKDIERNGCMKGMCTKQTPDSIFGCRCLFFLRACYLKLDR